MRCIALACAILFLPFTAVAQQLIPTQPSVASIIPDNDVVHVFTDRVDLDFNGEQGEGDLPAQWMIIDPGTLQPRSTYTFPWATVTAKHPALDATTGLMFVGVGDSVWAFTSRTQVRGSEPVFVGPHEAIGYDARASVLLITQRPSFSDPGTVVTIDLITKQQTERTIDVNPQQVDFYRNAQNDITAVILCEGTFGNADGSVVFYDMAGVQSLEVGDTPNDLVIDEKNNTAFVVMNGSHSIKVIDLDTRTITDTWETGTSGFDGPRNIAITDGYAFVTSYSGQIHVFTRSNGQRVASAATLAKADPIAVVETTIWVGHSFDLGTYNPAGDVAIYPLGIVSVNEKRYSSHPTALMVAGTTVRLPMFSGSEPLTITDLQGARVAATIVSQAPVVIDCSSLPSGVFVVSDRTRSILLTVRH